MIDLQNAENCIKAMKEQGTYQNHKIGIILRRIDGTIFSYKPGDVVIFREEEGSNRVTIEKPMSQRRIDEQRTRGSLLTTCETRVCVPLDYLGEVVEV